MVVAETDRLSLRPFDETDAASLKAVFGDPEMMLYGDGPQTGVWIEN